MKNWNEEALMTAKRLINSPRDIIDTNDERFLIDAGQLLLGKIEEKEGKPQETTLPDSPGHYWSWLDLPPAPYWGIVEIGQNPGTDFTKNLPELVIVSENGYLAPPPGRWIKINPPPS